MTTTDDVVVFYRYMWYAKENLTVRDREIYSDDGQLMVRLV